MTVAWDVNAVRFCSGNEEEIEKTQESWQDWDQNLGN
jgi:hypothetical protein